MAAKASIDRLGTNLIENEENSRGGQLLAQPVEQPRRTFVPALPLIGHLRPEAMLPVVVQLQRIPGAAYTAPHAGTASSYSNPIPGLILRGRGGS